MVPYKTSLPHLYLKQGEMSILETPALVSTILGSCVAVTLFNARLGIAAISHALLPHCKQRTYQNKLTDLLANDCARCQEAFKYVDCAVCMMVEAFSRFGIRPGETQVQLHGGARMFSSGNQLSSLPVGLQNSAVAKKVIADHGLALSVCDIGGSAGRKIFFNTRTGGVSLRVAGRHVQDDHPEIYRFKKGEIHAAKESNTCPGR
jgi:chemotaxis protein CheD